MNNVNLIGRLVKDPEVRYSQTNTEMAVARYTLAVNRSFKREGEPEADFINCVAFGKTGQFVEKYFKKGMQTGITGKIQVRSWDNAEGKKQWGTDVIATEVFFADTKKTENEQTNNTSVNTKEQPKQVGYESIPDPTLDDLPF